MKKPHIPSPVSWPSLLWGEFTKKRYISLSTIVFRLFQLYVLLIIVNIFISAYHSLLEMRLLPESTEERQIVFSAVEARQKSGTETLYCAECDTLAFSPFLSSVRQAQQEAKLVSRKTLNGLGEPAYTIYCTYGSAVWARIEWLPRWQQTSSTEYPVNVDYVVRLWPEYFSVEDIERDSIWAYQCDSLLPDLDGHWESVRRYAQKISDNGEDAAPCRLADDAVQFSG